MQLPDRLAVGQELGHRAHRIGQTRPVFAYRLIARDTVEEKVLQLQKTKRALADAILSEDNSLIRDLKKEDLELLLSCPVLRPFVLGNQSKAKGKSPCQNPAM